MGRIAAGAGLAAHWRPRSRAALLDRYLLGSMLRPALASFGVTLLMMLLERSIRLVNEIAASGAQVRFFFPLIAGELPYYVGLALPAAFFISMFMVIIRLDEGNELEAMLASGRSLARITLPLVGVGLVLALISLAVFGFVEPLGRYSIRSTKAAAVQAGWSGELRSKAFVTPDASSILSADAADADGAHVRGVFLSRMLPGGRETVVTGASGRLSNSPDGKRVRLAYDHGREMTEQPDGRLQVLQFENVVLDAPRGGAVLLTPRGVDQRELTLSELWRERWSSKPRFLRAALDAELLSRLGRSLSLPLLPLLAFPLGVASKRGRRAPGLILAAIVLICFHHGVQLIASLASLGKLDPVLGLGGLFAAFTGFVSWLFLSSLRRPGETPLSRFLARVSIVIEAVAGGLARLRRMLGPARASKPPRNLSLGGYVARLLLTRTTAAAAVIVALLQIIELLERTGEILARGVGLGGLAYYALLQLPAMTQQSIGFAMFAGAVLTFMELARNGEMIAMRAAGVSLRQLLAMLMPVALLVGAFDLVVSDQVAPGAERALRDWLAATAPAREAGASTPHWFRAGGEMVRVERASQTGDRLEGVRIYQRNEAGLLIRRIVSPSAKAGPGGWSLQGAQILDVTADGAVRQTEASRAWPTSLKPADVTAVFHPTLQISAVAAVKGLAGAASDQSPGYYATRLYRLLAEPLAPVIMLLLAAPLALAHGRNARNLGLMLYGIGGGMAYLVADGLLTVSGQTGALPAALAAWSAPLAFATAAVTVLIYAEA